MAYERRKLHYREKMYDVHEKEMIVIVHFLQAWRHYLLGKPFIAEMENMATSYFSTQLKLSPKKAHWKDFLVEFDVIVEYRPCKLNAVAITLSRKT
jgi:hypothetical protein